MTKQELEELQTKLKKANKDYCNFSGGAYAVCDPDACSACISGFYKDECAFEVVNKALNELIKRKDDRSDRK